MNAIVNEEGDAGLRERVLARVAELAALDVPPAQIAATCGIRVARAEELLASDEIRTRVAEIRSERFEAQQRLTAGWDAVEEDAVAQVIEYMHASKDPEYALRAARVANQAVRRGPQAAANGQGAINGGVTAHAVINLSAIFVEKLQAMRVGMREIEKEAHRVDALPLAQAERLLQTDVQRELQDIFRQVAVD